jgi:hypothetical protein
VDDPTICPAEQATQFVTTELQVDCADKELDNALYVIKGGKVTDELYDPKKSNIVANDNTDALNDIAVASGYSITLKDDGKVLYRCKYNHCL